VNSKIGWALLAIAFGLSSVALTSVELLEELKQKKAEKTDA
jgi:hypothetical protein